MIVLLLGLGMLAVGVHCIILGESRRQYYDRLIRKDEMKGRT